MPRRLDSFLSGAGSGASLGDTLFVIAGGANDARGAYSVIAGGANDARGAYSDIAGGANASRTSSRVARTYANDVGKMVDRPQAAGATHIVVWDTPDIGKTPEALSRGAAAAQLETQIAGRMNQAPTQRLTGEAGVSIFGAYSLVDFVISHRADHGLVNVTDACGAIAGCDPETFLFWDAIHPTSAGHKILADEMFARYGSAGLQALAPVPEPATVLLWAAGLAVVAGQARARTRRSTSSASL